MKYTIDITIDEGREKGAGLGTYFEVDTSDPEWRDQLPSQQALAAIIDEHGADAEPTLAMAAEVLRRLGYDGLVEVVEEADCVVDAAKSWVRDDGTCHFCGYHETRPHHDTHCPLYPEASP